MKLQRKELNMNKKLPKKMGRVPIFDSEKLIQLEDLMRIKPSLEDSAAFFKCDQKTIERVIRKEWDKTFVDFRQERMVHTRLMLQRDAVKMAKRGNVVMMIFCLKNMCGWADKMEQRSDVTTSTSVQIKPMTIQEIKDILNGDPFSKPVRTIKQKKEITDESTEIPKDGTSGGQRKRKADTAIR